MHVNWKFTLIRHLSFDQFGGRRVVTTPWKIQCTYLHGCVSNPLMVALIPGVLSVGGEGAAFVFPGRVPGWAGVGDGGAGEDQGGREDAGGGARG